MTIRFKVWPYSVVAERHGMSVERFTHYEANKIKLRELQEKLENEGLTVFNLEKLPVIAVEKQVGDDFLNDVVEVE